MTKIGIIGNGYVGGATSLLGEQFANNPKDIEVYIYDKNPDLCSRADLSLEDLVFLCDFIFVCVPTPMEPNGTCSTLQVKMVVASLLDLKYSPERIIVKSTVPVGTCKQLGVMFMPEFLTEANWEKDFINQKDWILGTNERNDKIRDEVYNLFKKAHSNNKLKHKPIVHFLSTEEAELVKYVRNCFLAVKVSFFNEIYSFCKFHHINYDRVKDIVVLDDRIGGSHTQVPGPDGKFGFGGTCFPKDMAAFQAELVKVSALLGLEYGVIKSCISRKNKLDRPEKDWKKNKGRSVT